MLNIEKTVRMLISHPIFASLQEEKVEAIASDQRCSYVTAASGQSVTESDNFVPALCLILSGTVLVYRKGGGLPVLLQKLGEGKLFGAASLFSGEGGYVTEIRAGSDCTVFSIPCQLIDELIRTEPSFAISYITFLSEKIRFLNKRLSELSAPTIEQKLAIFLLRNDGAVAPNRSQFASVLGIGRASLYRVLDELRDKGLIGIYGKDIVISDRNGLMKLI